MAVMASHCPHITIQVVDLNKRRVDAWNSDSLPIFEPGLEGNSTPRHQSYSIDCETIVIFARKSFLLCLNDEKMLKFRYVIFFFGFCVFLLLFSYFIFIL